MKLHGLTLGKYAPFHRGHELVIQTALSEMGQVTVLIYDAPDETDVPLHIRSQWIKDLFPSVEVIEVTDGPGGVGYTDEIKRAHEKCISKYLRGRKITHFYSSEPYGDHVSKSLNAKDRQVDASRRMVPISGTQIRSDVYKHREFLSPRVYRDLIHRVVFLGAPSTGKTTIAEKMASRMNTAWMPEYGREYWEKHNQNRRLSEEQLLDLAIGHLEIEDEKATSANKFLFVDTNAITTAVFSDYYHRSISEDLVNLALSCKDKYDTVFLCLPDIPYENTEDRSGDTNRHDMHNLTKSFLEKHHMIYIELSGSIVDRMNQVTKRIHDYQS